MQQALIASNQRPMSTCTSRSALRTRLWCTHQHTQHFRSSGLQPHNSAAPGAGRGDGASRLDCSASAAAAAALSSIVELRTRGCTSKQMQTGLLVSGTAPSHLACAVQAFLMLACVCMCCECSRRHLPHVMNCWAMLATPAQPCLWLSRSLVQYPGVSPVPGGSSSRRWRASRRCAAPPGWH